MRRSGGGSGYGRDPVLLSLAALGVLAVSWFLAGPYSPVAPWVLQTGLDVMILLSARRLAAVTRAERHARRFWRAMAAAMLLCTVGDSYQTVLLLADPGRPGVSVVQTALVVAGMSIMAVTMLCHPLAAAGRERLRLWLDAVTVLTGVAVFLWYFSLAGQLSSDQVADRYAAGASAAVMLVVVFGVLKLVFSDLAPFTRTAGIVGSLGVAGTALGTSVGMMLGGAHDPRVLAVAQVVPCILMPVSLRLQEVRARRQGGRRPGERRARFSRTPYVAVIATEVLLVTALPAAGPGARIWGVTVGVVIITALVVGRQLVAFTDNDRLLTSLDRSMTELHRQKEWFQSLVQHASDLTLVVEPGGTIRYASPAAARVLGTEAEQAVGERVDIRIHPGDLPVFQALNERLAAEPGTDASAQVRLRHADGSYRWLDIVGADLTASPSVCGIVYNARDVTEAMELQDRLRHRATHDTLTGLANRTLLGERLLAAGDAEVGVLVVDLDGFKQVNDGYGHHAGDEVLVAVAARLGAALGPGDLAVRLGGDEFAVLLDRGGAGRAREVADRIVTAMGRPIEAAGTLLAVGASVGIATGRADDPDRLLRDADAAMYRVKQDRAAV
ncbi:diguanylate cyclase [Actinoplanes sp. NPDC049548]|uniref:diguanylate cyclase domain-containing protein n=1 Tax=Actinoplanes sp. NPDC049548 TaxID=3155152 RepID=UPI00341514AC